MSLSYLYSAFLAKIFATSVTLFAGIISLKLVANYLSLAQFGLFMVASQLLAYLPFIDGGLRTVINRELLVGTEERRLKLLNFAQLFYSWFGLLLVPLVSVVMALYSITPNAARSGEPLVFFLAMGFSVALLVFAFAQANLLIGLNSQSTLFWITGGSNLVQLTMLFVGFKLGWELWAYPFANGISFLITWPVIAVAIRSRVPGLQLLSFGLTPDFWAQLRSLRREALNSFLSQLSTLFLFTVDLVIVGMWVSLQEAALYALLMRVLSIVRSFIQTLGEVSWPTLARNSEESGGLTRILLNVNAWIYGSVAGALVIFLLPFLGWYMESEEWVASELLFVLLLSRFLIVGLQSPGGYFLISAGEFGLLARTMWRELIAAVVLALVLLGLGGVGVAAGFLASTVFGTGYFILAGYARHTGQRSGSVIFSVWGRALAGSAVSFLAGWMLQAHFSGFWAAFGGAISAGVALTLVLGIAAIRSVRLRRGNQRTWKSVLRFV